MDAFYGVVLVSSLLKMRYKIVAIRFCLFLAGVLVIGLQSCSIHSSASRVSNANKSIMDFLVRYGVCQAESLVQSKRYVPDLVARHAPECDGLARSYAEVRKHEYACKFDVNRNEYSVRCLPSARSGLTISFYLDQSRAIRIADRGMAGPTSQRVTLNDVEERRLRGLLSPPDR